MGVRAPHVTASAWWPWLVLLLQQPARVPRLIRVGLRHRQHAAASKRGADILSSPPLLLEHRQAFGGVKGPGLDPIHNLHLAVQLRHGTHQTHPIEDFLLA